MTFRNTVYLVSYASYTSGVFIKTLIEFMLYGKDLPAIDWPLNGRAEIDKDTWPIHNTFYLRPEYGMLKNITDKNIYDYISTSDKQQITLGEHSKPNHDKLFKKFPNARNIIIQFGEKTALRLIAYSHYKQKYKLINNLNELSHDEDRPVIDYNYQEFVRLNYFKNLFMKEEFFEDYVIPNNLTNKVFAINFYDIIHNRDKVLQTLSQITKKQITPNLIASYDNYLQRQSDLIPWLDDK